MTMLVDGSGSDTVPCASWDGSVTGGRNGRPMTFTFRVQVPSPYSAAAYAKRAASWTIAIYEEQS
ncbi:MAG TPA: hypothetical protein VFQ68_20820 [Streptosporangiaceae bacterium]|nr:hypothetical protein [Streptosporangiaceae bacterium]